LFVVAATGAVAQPGDQARGVVFEDVNGNGSRDPGEPGLPGVAVANGVDVVVTDADGAYRIQVEPEQILFITQPRGYRVPVDRHNLPQFFHRHYPDGTPVELALRFRGVDPTGELPSSVDFPLRRTDVAERFEAIWFADPQPQSPAEIGYVRDDVVAELIGTDAVFGVTLGDIMYDDLALIPRQNALIAQIGIPWYNVGGNHELNFLAPDARYARETFKRYFGPTYYSFDYGDVHFVMLDDVHYLGRGQGRDDPSPRQRGGYEGRLDEVQLEWLRQDLALVPEERMVVLGMHIPLVTHSGGDRPSRLVVNRAELFRVLGDRPNVMAVAGHTHTTEHHYLGQDQGYEGETPFHLHVLTTVSGSWWSGPFDERGVPVTEQRDGTPNGYHVMSVEGNRLSMRYKAAGKPSEYQMRISLDTIFHQFSVDGIRDYRPGQLTGDRITMGQVYSTEVVVNLFDGGPRSEVVYELADRPPVRMFHDARIDPFFQELFIRNEQTMKSWVRPERSSHIWTARLPADLGPGVHTLTVRATDEYGQLHVARKVFEVVSEELEAHP
jgi:3',5'-cyclic AMP phosphodiesterase CpdA